MSAPAVNPAVKGLFGDAVTISYFYNTEGSFLLISLAYEFVGCVSSDSQEILNVLYSYTIFSPVSFFPICNHLLLPNYGKEPEFPDEIGWFSALLEKSRLIGKSCLCLAYRRMESRSFYL